MRLSLPMCHWRLALLRGCGLFALLLALAGMASGTRAAVPAAGGSIELWPVIRILVDAGGRLDSKGAVAELPRFAAVDAPSANLGIRRDPVWLWIPLKAATSGADIRGWVLDIDYPSLDRVDVMLVRGGAVAWQAHLGDGQPFSQRPMPTRTHAVTLPDDAATAEGLLLRVETTSTMIVPARLVEPQRFHADERLTELLQGLALGVGLCLAVYSLACWIAMRERIFIDYALVAGGTASFFFSLYGLGNEHLWGENAWMTANASPALVLVALIGGYGFLDSALHVRSTHPLVSRALRAGAIASGLALAAFVLGLIDYRMAQTMGTALGPGPVVLGVPIAFIRARKGDRVALTMLFGWAAYGGGIAVFALLLRGLAPANPLTLHAFQIGVLIEVPLWLIVLGMRSEEVRRHAERARSEHDRLQSLALTDALTGLPNRRGLQQALDHALPRCHPTQLVAVYLLDLDGFKPVNDRLGHDAGDALLVEVGKRLKASVRTSDVVARLGGDEFVVVAQHLADDRDADRVGRKLLACCELPFQIGAETCRVGVTIGYALAPQDGLDGNGLLKRADAAMYAGKVAGSVKLQRGAASIGLASA